MTTAIVPVTDAHWLADGTTPWNYTTSIGPLIVEQVEQPDTLAELAAALTPAFSKFLIAVGQAATALETLAAWIRALPRVTTRERRAYARWNAMVDRHIRNYLKRADHGRRAHARTR